ncbi:MAG: sugar transferase [Bacillota bacterium]|nr:sugar transferase [Bacillota bacterium]
MLKRAFDLIIALVLIILLLPLMLILAVLIYVKMGKPVFFTQQRPGLNGRPFRLYKFRTMRKIKAGEKELATDEERLTGLGRFLRRFSLDELPQLFNVLKGELSFVGPRPLLMQYLERYTPAQVRRHEVKPGITGWAQVNGRNALSWEEKFKLDVWYVDHQSFLLDLKILALTVVKVLKAEGINREGTATMPEFMGSKNNNE